MRVQDIGPGPLFADDGPLGARLKRRVRGVGIELIALVLLTLLFPLVIALAAAVDLALWIVRRKPWMAVRLVVFAWFFLLVELRAWLGLILVYATTGGPFGRRSLRRRELVYELRIQWCASHLSRIRRLFGLRFEIEGLQLAGPGPVLILIRHASIIDNTLPDTLIGRTHGMGLRFVIKRELESVTTFDIGGRWVPCVFVRRGSGDTARELEKVRRLTHDIGPGEGILVYPEGTRHTDAKLARAKEVIAERQPEIAPLADRLRNVLPPRLGGPLALLDEGAGLDVVFCGHVGLDGFEHIRDIWAGGLVGTTVKVRFWRTPASEIPAGERERIEWLYERWQALDDWVGANRA